MRGATDFDGMGNAALRDLAAIEDVPFEDLTGSVVAVDAHNWLYRYLTTTVKFTADGVYTTSDGTEVANLVGVVQGLPKFFEHDITPVFVFDGGVTELDDFVRASRDAVRGATLTRSAGAESPARHAPTATRGPTQNALDDSESIVTPQPAESIAQAWIGPGFPMRAAKPTVETYRRRLDRTPAEDLTIGVTVVCNDEAMIDELGDTYGFRDHVTFDIREERDLTVEELRDLLAEEHDFFHYVGHVDERGMECADGFLDLRSLETTGVDAFLLNACTSYQQGMGLVGAGALGGVVIGVLLAIAATVLGALVAGPLGPLAGFGTLLGVLALALLFALDSALAGALGGMLGDR